MEDNKAKSPDKLFIYPKDPSSKYRILNEDTFQLLNRLPDNSCSFVFCDPPYDLPLNHRVVLKHELIRICSGVVIIYAWPEYQYLDPDQYLFWIKPPSSKNNTKNYTRLVEIIHVYGLSKFPKGIHWSQKINTLNHKVDSTAEHPHRKPPAQVEMFLRNHTKPGDAVFDPFAGSGVCFEVCEKMNRLYYGNELDPYYFNNIRNKIGAKL